MTKENQNERKARKKGKDTKVMEGKKEKSNKEEVSRCYSDARERQPSASQLLQTTLFQSLW